MGLPPMVTRRCATLVTVRCSKPETQNPAAVAGHAGRLPDLRIKKPISGRPEIGAQFQLWIFSYTILARLAKNELSRLFNAGGPSSRQRRTP
jgi:hypothetical protein